MKKQLIALLIVVVLLCGACFVACNSNADLINGYVFKQNNMAVYDDFVLPKYLGDEDKPTAVKWTSSDDEILKITERDEDFLAAIVNFPDTAKEITLTISAGNAKKEYVVTVNPLAASDFARAYVFLQNRSKVAVDFELDTSVEYKGKTATIAWSVAAGDPYIKVDGNKCIVDHQNESNPVSLRATFTYGATTSTRTYDFTVAKEPSHEEAMHRWHTIPSIEQDLPITGYVVAIHQVYGLNTTYTDATFYMVDEDYCSGYYIYQVGITEAEGKQMEIGSHVTVTGTKNTDYNGLFETTKGGKCVVDENVAKIKVEDHIYAFDNDLFAAAPTADYHVSSYVSLTNWKVKEVKTAPTAYGNSDLMILTKNGVDVALRTSKYLEYHYKGDDNQDFKDLAALCNTYKVDDIVTVKGIMSKYKDAYQMLMVKASDIKKTTADAEGTVYPGSQVKELVASIQKKITDEGLNKLVTTSKNVEMPTGSGNISVVYSKYSDSNAVAINENVITVTPGKAEDVNLKALIKNGDAYETYIIFNIKSEGKTDAEMVAAEKERLTLEAITKAGDVTLPGKGTAYEDVEITWAIKGETTLATLAEGKLTVTALPAAESKITLTATLKKGAVTQTKDIEVTIAAAPQIKITKVAAADLKAGTAYKLVMDHGQKGCKMYADGSKGQNYLNITDDLTNAKDVYLEAAADGTWHMYFLDGTTKKYINVIASGTYDNMSIDATATSAWTITDECMKTMCPGSNTEKYIGTYGDKTDIRPSALSYLSGDTNYACYLAVVE